MTKWALGCHWTLAGEQLLCWMYATRMADGLDNASGGHPQGLMAQRGAAALKVSRRPTHGLGFVKQR